MPGVRRTPQSVQVAVLPYPLAPLPSPAPPSPQNSENLVSRLMTSPRSGRRLHNSGAACFDAPDGSRGPRHREQARQNGRRDISRWFSGLCSSSGAGAGPHAPGGGALFSPDAGRPSPNIHENAPWGQKLTAACFAGGGTLQPPVRPEGGRRVGEGQDHGASLPLTIPLPIPLPIPLLLSPPPLSTTPITNLTARRHCAAGASFA